MISSEVPVTDTMKGFFLVVLGNLVVETMRSMMVRYSASGVGLYPSVLSVEFALGERSSLTVLNLTSKYRYW